MIVESLHPHSRVLSYPAIQQLTVRAPPGYTTSDLGQSVGWARLLSHLRESCPSLKRLEVEWFGGRRVTLIPDGEDGAQRE